MNTLTVYPIREHQSVQQAIYPFILVHMSSKYIHPHIKPKLMRRSKLDLIVQVDIRAQGNQIHSPGLGFVYRWRQSEYIDAHNDITKYPNILFF